MTCQQNLIYIPTSKFNNSLQYLSNHSNVVIPKGSGGANAGQPLNDSKLNIIGGDVTKAADVNKVFELGKVDGVIVALGGKTSDVGETMLTDGTENIMNAMKAKGVKRIAVVTVSSYFSVVSPTIFRFWLQQ